jgi:hypothetical protein
VAKVSDLFVDGRMDERFWMVHQKERKDEMTADQQTEWEYRKSERLGILCGESRPTVLEEVLATADANEWLFRDQFENGGGEF